MKKDDRRKFCTDESSIWFIDDLAGEIKYIAGEIKYRSFIFEYIREIFQNKIKRNNRLSKINYSAKKITFDAIGGDGSNLYSEVLLQYKTFKAQGTKIVVLGYNNGQTLVSKFYHEQVNQNF